MAATVVIDHRFCGPPTMHTASALFSDEGVLCAVARAVWIELPPKE